MVELLAESPVSGRDRTWSPHDATRTINDVFYHSDQVDADNDLEDYRDYEDSTLGDSDSSTSSESLSSSVYQYRYENGRRYHAFNDGAYLLPNDELEQDRLKRIHLLWKIMLRGRLYTAPMVEDPRHILDVGTGTGDWAIEIADKLPSANVIGTDLSPIQPLWVPPNCTFYIEDASNEWSFNHQFDLIHGRALCGCIADWPMFFRQVKNNLTPGGWVEMQDYASWVESDDDTIHRGPCTAEWTRELNRGMDVFGKSLDVAHKYAEWIREAGFLDVREEVIKIPIGGWAEDPMLKDMGVIQLDHMQHAIEAYTLALHKRVLRYAMEDTNTTIRSVKSEMCDMHNHWYVRYHFVIGRRPEF